MAASGGEENGGRRREEGFVFEGISLNLNVFKAEMEKAGEEIEESDDDEDDLLHYTLKDVYERLREIDAHKAEARCVLFVFCFFLLTNQLELVPS